jgi:ferredoxin
MGGDGVAAVRVGETDDPSVLESAAGCPMGAIAVYDESGEQAA